MKAFFVGLIFLVVVLLLTGVGFLLLPLILVLSFFLKMIVSVLLIIFGVWLLGKFILWFWDTLSKKESSS